MMNMFDKIRIKIKIHKMCSMMRKTMNKSDFSDSACIILDALRNVPQERKEGLLDACLKVLKNEH